MMAMISINANIIEGPWGGGNQAVKSLYNYLLANGHDVVTNLKPPDIDLILMIHPSRRLQIISYGIDDIRSYIALHPNTILVQRINTSDERKGTNYENEIVFKANHFADYTVFISSYLRDFYIERGFDTARPHSVILNGADEKIFSLNSRADWKHGEKLKIVTHHWSNNYMKGFDIYEKLDLLLEIEPFCNLFEFTIIGNIPPGLHFRNTQVIKPISGAELAQALKQHHIYLTASRNEPAGMHHIEGMRCGLPVLYLNSGALSEYCSPYGVEFNLINFERKLMEIREIYSDLRQKVLNCPYTATVMAGQYIQLFKKLIDKQRKNAIPEPALAKILKQHFIINPLIKVKQSSEFLQKVVRHYREN